MSAKETAHFDASALREAMDTPVLEIGGYRFAGVILSGPQWFPFLDQFLELQARVDAAVAHVKAEREGPAPAHPASSEWLAFWRSFLTAVFPKKRYRFWIPDPVDLLFREPYRTIQETGMRFFHLQFRENMPGASAELETSGTPSQPSP